MARSQVPVSTDGVSIDVARTAKEAKKKVDRDKDKTPIHVCGMVSHRLCPCWTCTYENCAACAAAML